MYVRLVEPIMGYPRHRETLAQSSSWPCDPVTLCRELGGLAERTGGGVACIYGPWAVEPLGGCSVNGGPESAVLKSLEWGLRLDYITGDMDLSPRLAMEVAYATRIYIAHLHGDNSHLRPPPAQVLAYSSQVESWAPCVIGGLGFTDGDRAVILAMALDASRVEAEGYWGPPDASHKDYKRAGYSKHVKLELSKEIIKASAAALGYTLLERPTGFTLVKMRI